MEVEGMGGTEGEYGRHAWGRGIDGAGPQGAHVEEAGVRGSEWRGDEEAHGNGRSWELLCWRFPYCLSVCHGISRPNKEEFK